MLHFRRNGSRFREQLYAISSPVYPTGVVHVLLHVKVTSHIDVDSITGGNVVRGNRPVMQMESLRDHPDMSYGSSEQWKQLCE